MPLTSSWREPNARLLLPPNRRTRWQSDPRTRATRHRVHSSAVTRRPPRSRTAGAAILPRASVMARARTRMPDSGGRARRRSIQPIPQRRTVPLCLGIVILGPGIQRIVTAASRATLTTTEGAILTGAAAVVMVAMSVIGTASASRRLRISSATSRSMALTLATLVVGFTVSTFGSPVAMVVVIASLSFGQLAVALSVTVPPKSTAHLAVATEQVSV